MESKPVKETFIVRTEWYGAISELNEIDQASILRNLFLYHLGENNLINLNSISVKLVWKLIEPNLKRNSESYDKRKDTSKFNGTLGGRPVKEHSDFQEPNPKPKKPKKPIITLSDSVIVSVIDPVIDPVIEIDPDPEIENVVFEIYPTFEDFWNEYDIKVGVKEKLTKKWDSINQTEKEKIMRFIPQYKIAQPDKQFRKRPESFLNQKAWNDELIFKTTKSNGTSKQNIINQFAELERINAQRKAEYDSANN